MSDKEFKVGRTVYFLVQQKDGDITLEEGKLISHDDEAVCITTYVGDRKHKPTFLSIDKVFADDATAFDAHDKLQKEIRKAKESIKQFSISYFEDRK